MTDKNPNRLELPVIISEKRVPSHISKELILCSFKNPERAAVFEAMLDRLQNLDGMPDDAVYAPVGIVYMPVSTSGEPLDASEVIPPKPVTRRIILKGGKTP